VTELVLRDFQNKTIDYGIKNNYSILALSMGLGKSVVALEISRRTKLKTLIVCPAYLRLVWKREIAKWYPDTIVSTFESSKDIYYPVDSDIAIISYESLEKSEKLFEWANLVVADEATYLKQMTSKRSEIFHKFVFENSIERLLLLTGTPLKNRVYEFYSLICLCNYNPAIIDSSFLTLYPSYVEFANRFSFLQEYEVKLGGGRSRVVQQWSGIRNVEELKGWLRNIYIRFEADKVLDLPESIFNDVVISEIDNPELLESFNSFIEENKSVKPDIKAKAALAKVPFTISYVKDLLQSVEKVVVYTDHVDSCEALAKGLEATAITGNTPMKIREYLANEFQKGDLHIIVATIGSFSTGITLTATNHMVISDYCWTPGDLLQTYARIRRIGQTKTCFYHRVIGSYQDLYILKKLEEKNETINIAVN
jgi:SNF2 family DNA or RNA helicase